MSDIVLGGSTKYRAPPYAAMQALASAAVRHNESTVRWLAALIGYPACPGCDFVADHCRCAENKRAYMPGVTWQGEGLA